MAICRLGRTLNNIEQVAKELSESASSFNSKSNLKSGREIQKLIFITVFNPLMDFPGNVKMIEVTSIISNKTSPPTHPKSGSLRQISNRMNLVVDDVAVEGAASRKSAEVADLKFLLISI